MSTPIQSLPQVDTKNPPPPANIDPSITNVLEEMEREVAAAQQSAPSMPSPSPSAQAPPMMSPQFPAYMYGGQNMAPLYIKDSNTPWFNTDKAKTAVVATLLAMLLLLPKIPFIYERFGRIAFLEPYELYIRAAMLALVLYVTMIKLNI